MLLHRKPSVSLTSPIDTIKSAAKPPHTWEEAVRWLCDQPGSAQIVHDAYYDDPLEGACDRYWQSAEWAEVRKLIGVGPGTALDCGAGRGIASYALARDGFTVTALEPDPSDFVGHGAIRAVAARCALPITVVSEITQPLPFDDQSFDLIFARAVLHHIPDLAQAMREFYRILKPGGKLLAIREHVISRDEDLPVFLAAHPLHHLYGGEMAYRLPVYTDAIFGSGLEMKQVISPLDNAVNFAPMSDATLGDGIARQLTKGVPVAFQLVQAAMRAPVLGLALKKMASRFDNRPGRHYSFLAQKV
jgi:SAM-dependent methyltransferase